MRNFLDKIITNKYSVINITFFLLFLLILIFTIISGIDNTRTKKNLTQLVDKCTIQPKIYVDSAFIKNNNTLDSGILKIEISIDSNYLHIISTNFEKNVQKLERYKGNFLDNNSISYLLQILSFFVIGLGVYLLNRGNIIVSTYENSFININELVNTIQETNVLVRICENINYVSIFFSEKDDLEKLSKKKKNNHDYNSADLRNAFRIRKDLDEINHHLDGKNISCITKYGKRVSISLLRDTQQRINKSLDSTSDFYYDIYTLLANTISRINELEVSNLDKNKFNHNKNDI